MKATKRLQVPGLPLNQASNKSPAGIKRGEVYLVELSPTRGSELRDPHPAVVISNDTINAAAAVVIVCPITSGPRPSPIHIRLSKGEGGLTKDCIAHCGQVRAVDKERLSVKRGDLPRATMASIDKGLKLAFSL
jgi:mRNA interferase MazF